MKTDGEKARDSFFPFFFPGRGFFIAKGGAVCYCGGVSTPLDLARIRSEYLRGTLQHSELAPEPVVQFARWMEEALRAGMVEPTAMSLATVGADGRPLARTVLLKGVDPREGFFFYTNLGSRKAAQIAENAAVCLLFPWLALERQVIIRGRAVRVPEEKAHAYFVTRPRESQLAAWASRQSSVIPSRETLETALEEARVRFGKGEVSLPPFWGGYRVEPETVEFWQGGASRLHDRFEYRRKEEGGWEIVRLSP